MKKRFFYNILFALICTAVMVYFFPRLQANHYKFEEGRPWNYSKLIAPFDIPIRPDTATVRNAKDSLNRTFAPVFARKADAQSASIQALQTKWNHDDSESDGASADKERRQRAVAYISNAYKSYILSDDFGEQIERGELRDLRIKQGNMVSKHTTQDILWPSAVIADMARAIDSDTVAGAKWIAENNIISFIQPSLEYDKETSQRFYQEDLAKLNQQMGAVISGVIQQGQTIIDKGAVITPQDYTNLVTYERMVDEQMRGSNHSMWILWLGQLIYVAAIVAALLCYLFFSAPKIWKSTRSMLFVLLLIVIFYLLAVGLDTAIDVGFYIVPYTIVTVLMVVFFDAPTALVVSMTLTLLCGGFVSFPLEFIVIQTLGSTAACYSLRELAKRSQLLRTSIFVFLSYLAGYLGIELMMNGSFDGISPRILIFLVVSAALASMAYILMVAIERAFGFVSIVTLIELTDTNNPILRELSQECPGTFQHSIAVSNLATDAAIRIHANEPLVRAGALYHDIGKINNPNFFTENQRGVNPHDALTPEQSARIIIGHVTDGVKRASSEGLPSVINDFILQHHGKGKAKYFYFTYCKNHPGEEVDPAPFTYPGPNPQTREASLLMMADSVEAASRSLKEHTPKAIADLVDKIVDSQIADGLHNESTLQFRDVKAIKEAFVRRLMTMYHARIVYPDDPNK